MPFPHAISMDKILITPVLRYSVDYLQEIPNDFSTYVQQRISQFANTLQTGI